MPALTFYCQPGNAATEQAGLLLKEAGIELSVTPEDITHYLAPVPTRNIPEIPAGVTLIGGNLSVPGLDLLKDPFYLAENAAITARCAIKLISKELTGLSVLVLGWGRIGKCLGKFLESAGAKVTVAARRQEDVAMIRALGQEAIFIHQAAEHLPRFDAVINTVPVMVLDTSGCRQECILLELASSPGMIGQTIIDGRGLPGKFAPAESGRLIARTILRLLEVKKP